MSTTLLVRSFGLVGYRYIKTSYGESSTFFHIKDEHPQCPVCGSSDVAKDGTVERTFRIPSIGLRSVFAVLPVPRISCRGCGARRQAVVKFADPMKSYSRAFSRLVIELVEHCDVSFTARFLNIGWNTVKEIQKKHLAKRFAKPRLKDLSTIAIDEIYLGRKLGYRTLVLNLTTGAVVYVGKGKDSKALAAFWKSLKSSGVKVKAVAMDMSRAFASSVRRNLPNADIVFDPFHVVKLMNEQLDDLRRELFREAATDADRRVIKGTRWILLRGRENLSEEPGKDGKASEQSRLEAALELNRSLAAGYYLKEDLRMLWLFSDVESGREWLRDWMAEAEASGIKQMAKMVKTLRAHEEGILAYFVHDITSGPMEGTNNKIRTLMKQTYGLRDEEYLELRIKSLHEAKLRLTGRL